MPPRLAGSLFALTARRQAQCTIACLVAPTSAAATFHSTACRQDAQIDGASNHYEALKVAPGATPADIKKSFYKLSKAHHPDHNQDDPLASKRFVRISEAYSTLSIPAKRAAYDRDTMNIGKSSTARSGSYSSTGPAGGRPASGLSKRRGTFRGPPPSFYRSGGWGGHSDKRKEAHDDSTGGAASGTGSSSTTRDHWSASGPAPGTGGGMGPGQDPFGHADDVPHFDRVSHEKTGHNQALRRARRRSGLPDDFDVTRGTGGLAGSFFLITGCIILVLLAPLTYGSAATKKTKESKT